MFSLSLEIKLLITIFNAKDIIIIRNCKRFSIIFILCIIDIFTSYGIIFFIVVIVTPEDLILIKYTALISLMREEQRTSFLFYYNLKSATTRLI